MGYLCISCHLLFKELMVIVYVVNVDWFFMSHRLPLAKHALEEGNEVYILTADTGWRKELENLGVKFVDIPFKRSGINPFHEIKCISQLVSEYKRIKPDIVHHITLKSSLCGSIAAKIAGVKNVINAISGFGYMFTDDRKGLVKTILSAVIKVAYRSKHFSFILQNPDDINSVKKMNLVPNENVYLIKGSGVNLNTYAYTEPIAKDKLEVLFPARILRDKGVVELIESAQLLKDKYFDCVKFVLAGDCDEENPAVLHESELKELLVDNYIEWIGYIKNMYPVYQQADIVALPSYREGLPKSLIEACAVGRPIVTTNAIGCKECVVNGINGYLVPVKSVNDLADALESLIIDEKKRLSFGKCSRKMAEQVFSIDSVIDKTFAIYNTYRERSEVDTMDVI